MSLVDKLCKELGVKAGESWLGSDGVRYTIGLFGQILQFNADGYVIKSGYDKWADIFAGDLKPVWKPKKRDKYYVPSVSMSDKYIDLIWTNCPGDEKNYKRGIAFRTKEEAIEMANKMLELAKERGR